MIQEQPWDNKTIIITLSRVKLCANNDSLCEQAINHMPGTFKSHMCIFFFHSRLTVALCGPHLVWRNWGMTWIQVCAWLEKPIPRFEVQILCQETGFQDVISEAVHIWLKINWFWGVHTEIWWICLGVLFGLTFWDRDSGCIPSYSRTH